VDFTGMQPKCGPSDYENWTPSDPSDTQGNCILGETTVYRRRRRESTCYNGEDYEPLVLTTYCPCAREDFECDFCFEESLDGSCVLSTTDNCTLSTAPPPNCISSYRVSKGYRFVPGTNCDPNMPGSVAARYMPKVVACPGTKTDSGTSTSSVAPDNNNSGGGTGSKIGLIILIIFLVLGFLVIVHAIVYFILVKRKVVKNLFATEQMEKYFIKYKNRTGNDGPLLSSTDLL